MQRKIFHLRSHSWITMPDPKTGISKLGLTDYAIKFFLRFNKIDITDYTKTKYGINNSTFINMFLKQTKTRYQNELLFKQKQKQEGQQTKLPPNQSLTLSEKMQYERFLIKRNESFATLKTYQFDIEMSAPVDMRVIDQNFDNYYYNQFITVPYFFEIQCLNQSQLQDLISQEQYVKSAKFFQYC